MSNAIVQRVEVVCTAGTTILVPAVVGVATSLLKVTADPQMPSCTIAGDGSTNTDVTVTFTDEGTYVFAVRFVQA